MLAEMSDELLAEAGKPMDDAPSEDTEASRDSNAITPLADGGEGVKGEPERGHPWKNTDEPGHNVAANTPGSGNAGAAAGKGVAANNGVVVAAKPNIKMLLAVNLKTGTRKGVKAKPGLPKKSQPHGSASGKAPKANVFAGTLAKAAPGNRPNHNYSKATSPGARPRSTGSPVTGKQKSIKISHVHKGMEAKSGRDNPPQRQGEAQTR